MKKFVDISVVIPTMNRPNSLRHTLDSYLEGDSIPNEFVVIDQSSNDGVRKENKDILYNMHVNIKMVYINQNIPSLTAARNAGIRKTSNEIVVFSDDDIEVKKDTISEIYKIMQQDTIAMVAGLDEFSMGKSSKLGYIFDTKSWKNRNMGHVTSSLLGRYPDNVVGIVNTQWAMGYFFAIKKSLQNKWDILWDENLKEYAYAEDLDFSYSYYKKSVIENKICVLSDKIVVRHLVSKEYRIPSKKNTYMYVLHRQYLRKKHNMGVKSSFCMTWCDFWRLVEKIIKREKPLDLLEAYCYYFKHRQDILKGVICFPPNL